MLNIVSVMNKGLIIATPTHNRSACLRALYESLKIQTNKNFVWFICNDGSTDNTHNTVNSFIEDNVIEIVYKEKENTGKSKTLNEMFDFVRGYKFMLIVDDDEVLYGDAVATVHKFVSTYYNTDCGIIHFNRDSLDGHVISNFDQNDDLMLSFQEKLNKGYDSDGYVGYFVEKLGYNRFPIFDNEKYVAPAILIMLVTRNCKMLWAKKSIGKTEYREDGITKAGRILRLKNPCGMIYYSLLMQDFGFNAGIRLKYSILGYAYMFYSKRTISEVADDKVAGMKFIPTTRFWGFLLYFYWRVKYILKEN